MRILHIVGGHLKGGAARGAYWLHQGLRDLGIDSSMLVQFGSYADPTVDTPGQTKFQKSLATLRPHIDKLPLWLYRRKTGRLFNPCLIGTNLSKHPFFERADIVHLHWIANAFVTPAMIQDIRKPVVWTLRDMWPFTGGCHYPLDCSGYQTGCGECPVLSSKHMHDLSRYLNKRKRTRYGNHVHPVAISNWLAECARSSSIFSDYDVRVIHNGVNTSQFSPIAKDQARQILGLPNDKTIVLFGCLNPHGQPHKGHDLFTQAMATLDNPARYHCLVFGTDHLPSLSGSAVPTTYLGRLHDDIALAVTYSAADVYVQPARQEAFGKTLIESMACATPVVAFDATGPRDIITHKHDGYLASPFEADDLASGIQWVSDDTTRLQALSRAARTKATDHFSVDVIASRYAELYEDLHAAVS